MRIILFHSSLCPALNCFSESGSPSTPKTATELRLQFWAAASKEWWNKKTQGELNHLPWKSYFPLKKIINLMFHNQKKNKEILFEKKQNSTEFMSYRYRVPAACYRVQGKPIRILFQETFARIGPWVIKKHMVLFLVGIHEDI